MKQARVGQERRKVRATRAQSGEARRGRGMAEELAEAEQPTPTTATSLCSPITRAVGQPGTEQQGGEYQHVHIATKSKERETWITGTHAHGNNKAEKKRYIRKKKKKIWVCALMCANILMGVCVC